MASPRKLTRKTYTPTPDGPGPLKTRGFGCRFGATPSCIEPTSGLAPTPGRQHRAKGRHDCPIDRRSRRTPARRLEKWLPGSIAATALICRVLGVTENGVALDTLISELAKQGIVTTLKAKRSRAAAGLRTFAAHARWEEIDLGDVAPVIELTRNLSGRIWSSSSVPTRLKTPHRLRRPPATRPPP
jgi:hypothetical protein